MLRRANAPASRARAAGERARRQARRLQAAELFAQGVRPAQVARTLGVSKQSASRWHAAWQGGGVQALASKGPTGVTPRLSDGDLERVAQALGKGASAHGFTGELWTLRRIATVIERLTGVRYHLGPLWAVLHQGLGWSVQRPIRRAAERDEATIRRWVAEDWPRLKANARRRNARIVFFDESGASCCQACAAPGRRSAGRRCCATRSTGSAPRWPPHCATGPPAGAPRCASTSTRAATTPAA